MNRNIEIIAIDHGWSHIKTRSTVFVSGVEENVSPTFFYNVLEYNGKFYNIGGKRIEVKNTKVDNNDFYLLTLAAIARELKNRNLTDANVYLAVGLPLTRFGEEKQAFIDYLKKDKEVTFKYAEKEYHITIEKVSVFPQCYAAVADMIPTLSYAEIKAVATGNPLIKEKMEVDNDVQRLKLLKASYDNQRYTLQDNFMIRFPKLIKAAKEKLECVKEDVRHRDDELIANPEFAIKIQGVTFTERVEAGTQALSVISKCKTGETTTIGSFKGFELLVEKNFMGFNYIVLKGKSEYKAELSTSPVGSMIKIENLFNGLEENVDFLEKKIEQYEADLAQSKLEYEKPFAHEEEYKEKLKRQCELNAQLDLENKEVIDADLGSKDKDSSLEESEIKEKSYSDDIGGNASKVAESVAEKKPDYGTGGIRR